MYATGRLLPLHKGDVTQPDFIEIGRCVGIVHNHLAMTRLGDRRKSKYTDSKGTSSHAAAI